MAVAVANRYARALADVVARTGDYRAIHAELATFSAVYQDSAELRGVLESPAIALAEKMRVLDAVLGRLGASQVTTNFLRVLLTNYRMGLLAEVREAFRRISNDRLGVTQVKILSASDLSDAQRNTLRARFAELTRNQVELEFHLDPALLGGIRAQIGSTVYDGSVRGHLERLREQLLQPS